MTVGEKIKCLRIKKNMTQEELAKLLNTTKQNVYKYENDLITNIPLDKIKKLAEIFDVSPFYIIGWQSDVPLEGNKKSEVLKLVEEIQAKKDKNFIVMGKGGKGQEVIEMTEEQQALLKALIDSWNKDK